MMKVPPVPKAWKRGLEMAARLEQSQMAVWPLSKPMVTMAWLSVSVSLMS